MSSCHHDWVPIDQEDEKYFWGGSTKITVYRCTNNCGGRLVRKQFPVYRRDLLLLLLYTLSVLGFLFWRMWSGH